MSLDVSKKTKIIQNNFELINAIRRCNTKDKKQIAKVLDVSWPTASTLIKELLSIHKTPAYLDTSGKYCICKEFGYFVGIAVGGVETKLSIIDFELNPIGLDDLPNFDIYEEIPQKFHLHNPDYKDIIACFRTPEYSQEISELCNSLLRYIVKYFDKSYDKDLLGIGFTFPGVFGNMSGNDKFEMGFCPNLSRLVGISLLELFDKSLIRTLSENNISFIVCHDTEAVTVFEKEQLYLPTSNYHIYKDKPNVACIYLGIGLGMGLIINNSLLHGSCNSVGEIGHLIAPCVEFDDNELTKDELKEKNEIANENRQQKTHTCYCGIKDCLEHQLRVNVFDGYNQDEYSRNTELKKLKSFSEDHPYKYRVFKRYIAYLMNLIINLLNVDVIIFAGRIFNQLESLRYDIDRLKISSALSTSANSCKIIIGTNRADVVALGGAVCSYFNHGFNTQIISTDKALQITWPKTMYDE